MTQTKQLPAIINPVNLLKQFCSLNLLFICCVSLTHAQTPPPELGEETKGKPAIDESTLTSQKDIQKNTEKTATETKSVLGNATVTEHKRENGQIRLIEIENSLGGKQYLYENDSDGKIGSSVDSDKGVDEIPKWKLGSW